MVAVIVIGTIILGIVLLGLYGMLKIASEESKMEEYRDRQRRKHDSTKKTEGK